MSNNNQNIQSNKTSLLHEVSGKQVLRQNLAYKICTQECPSIICNREVRKQVQTEGEDELQRKPKRASLGTDTSVLF